MEEEAAACNDGLLVLDEAGRINADASKAKYFGALAFLGAGGQGCQRSKKAVEDPNLQNVRFLLVGLSNGEEPLDDPRTPRRGGEQVRLISVPVPAPEKGGVFDLAPDGETRRELADEAGAVCGAHHGMAIKRFVWGFVHDPELAGRAWTTWPSFCAGLYLTLIPSRSALPASSPSSSPPPCLQMTLGSRVEQEGGDKGHPQGLPCRLGGGAPS